jgi:glycerol uptake facilitator-like aquaporin
VGGALGGEVVCTALLCFTVLLTACTKSNDVKPMAPLAIGFSVFLAHTVMIPIDGCSINPARSFGPALIAGEWANFWVFVAGPLLGGVVGTLLWAGVAVRWDKRDLFSGDAVLGQAASPAAKDALV